MEIWKDIPGYEGKYQASSMGGIKSLKGNPKQLLQSQTKNGYLCVSLRKDKRSKNWLSHRLIGIAFLGDNPTLDINHKNGIKTDNRIENLEWCTRAENIQHSWRLGLSKPNYAMVGKIGPLHGKSIRVIQKDKAGNILNRFSCLKEAAFTTGIWISGISAALNGIQKTAGKCLWEFDVN